MDTLTKLFNLLEMSRKIPQYGFAMAGGDMRLGNLAEHHYMVTMIAWQLAMLAKSAGAKIDSEKVLQFALIHDIGELFGGDIGMYYARANPKARQFAKQFEAENQKFISGFFGTEREHIAQLTEEILNAKTDESRIVKIADYIELSHYKFYVGKFEAKLDIDLITEKLKKMSSEMQDSITKKKVSVFIAQWIKDMKKHPTYLSAISDSLQ